MNTIHKWSTVEKNIDLSAQLLVYIYTEIGAIYSDKSEENSLYLAFYHKFTFCQPYKLFPAGGPVRPVGGGEGLRSHPSHPPAHLRSCFVVIGQNAVKLSWVIFSLIVA